MASKGDRKKKQRGGVAGKKEKKGSVMRDADPGQGKTRVLEKKPRVDVPHRGWV